MASQYGHLMLDSDILSAVVRTRIEHRAKKKSGARQRVASLALDNPFFLPTPPELIPWRRLKPRGRRRPSDDRATALLAALVWAMMVGFVAVAYALHAPLTDFPTP